MQILDIKNLRVDFKKGKQFLNIVSGIDLKIEPAQIVGIAGESGSGKTVSMLSLANLLPSFDCRISYDSYKVNRIKVDDKQIPFFRGRLISYIFQDPVPSLDPMFMIKSQLKEVLSLSSDHSVKNEVMEKLLKSVGLEDAERVLNSYPHQLSGGMAQRVAIAIALASKSKILVADEPTTALDANLKKGILKLLKDLKDENNLSIFFVSHDLEQMFYIADRIYIFYAGMVVEAADASHIKKAPLHPYTAALLKCVPQRGKSSLIQIKGRSPNFTSLPSGCPFHPRCEFMDDICQRMRPPLIEVKKGHFVRCFKVKK
ncbi:MAG: ABC transporter ATP-binding protein [Candidatus Saelkia tenebricola]|nr:ABC transporter ATP-binding protein [Candidatus Saelkia tenebricola]